MYESSTNYAGIIVGIVIAQAIICAIACGFIATTKNRDALGYAMAGLFLGIIGLIVAAAVPRLDEDQHQVETRRTSVDRLTPSEVEVRGISSHAMLEYVEGTLTVGESQIVFVPDSVGESLTIPIQAIKELRYYKARQFPNDMPFRAKIDNGLIPVAAIRVTFLLEKKTREAYFVGRPGRLLAIFDGRLKPYFYKIQYEKKAAGRAEESETKTCPYCAETIKAKAVVCRYCGRDLVQPTQDSSAKQFCVITNDIFIDGSIAFSKGEQVEIEGVVPDPNSPEHKHIVLSKTTGKKYRLSDSDLSMA